MRALRTSTAPVRAGITHWSTLSWRWALATSSGVWSPGSVPPSTGAWPAWSSLAPRARDQAVAARAAPVRAVLATVAWATPCWLATRPLLAPSRTVPPTTWAAMPARLTGVQRFQPALATRSRCLGSSTSAAAPLSPTAPISEPPNQVARPRSCRERETVLSAVTVLLLHALGRREGVARGPAAPAPIRLFDLSLVPAELVLVAVDLDVLLADLLGDLALVGDGLGVEADPLLGHGSLVDHDLLLAQGELVLLLGDGRAAGGGVAVGVGDRLALDPDLLALHRHGHLLGLGHDVLAQPGPAPLASLGADPQLLLGAGHGVVGGRPRGVAADCTVLHVVIDAVAVPVARVDVLPGAGGQAGVGAVLAVLEAVVAVQLGLLVLGEAPVGPHGGGVLDLLLVVGHLDAVTHGLGLGEGHKGGLGGEQAAGDRGPLGLAGLVVEVDGVDRAELVAGRVDHGAALPALNGVDVRHTDPLLVAGWMADGWWTGRLGPVSCRGVPPSGRPSGPGAAGQSARPRSSGWRAPHRRWPRSRRHEPMRWPTSGTAGRAPRPWSWPAPSRAARS